MFCPTSETECKFFIQRKSEKIGDVAVDACHAGIDYQECTQKALKNSDQYLKETTHTLAPGMAACEYFEYENDQWYGPKYNEGKISGKFECNHLPVCKEKNSAANLNMALLIVAAGSIASTIF